jgi:hypothetical protein
VAQFFLVAQFFWQVLYFRLKEFLNAFLNFPVSDFLLLHLHGGSSSRPIRASSSLFSIRSDLLNPLEYFLNVSS